jgi:hypothetical protein
MPFVIDFGFATEHDKQSFAERALPKLRCQLLEDGGESAEGNGLYRLSVSVTSQSAARDICHQIVSFLAHSKKDRVTLSWKGLDGSEQTGEVVGEAPRDAEILAVRVGTAAKAHLDQEKSAGVES